LLLDENGMPKGNDWAHGFMRGTMMCHDGWAELANDEAEAGCLVLIFMLHYEHDPDPELRPKPISPEVRQDVIQHMSAGLLIAYRHFRERREAEVSARTAATDRRTTPKVGRNDPCACGSGKKYKKCCGAATVN
ncbi:MAG: UPF0149 family protein, partial [Candidatus Tumulicola sp.]